MTRRMRWRSGAVCGAGVATLAVALSVPASGVAANSFGSLNSGFAGTGVVVNSTAQLVGVAANASGDVYAVGQAGANAYVEELSPTGTVLATYTGPAGIARAVTVQANGDPVIAGSDGSAMFAERFSPSLVPDSSFGANGIATAFSGQTAVANAVAVTSSGNVVIAGSEAPPVTSGALAEFTSTGALNASFGSGGTVVNGLGGYGVINGIAVEPTGQIAYAGSQTTTEGLTNGVIGVLNADGSNDSSFSAPAYHYNPSGGSSGYTSFRSIAAAPGNQLVVGGVDYGGQQALVLRYNATGSLDSTFGSGGVTTISAAGSVSSPDSAVGAYGIALAGGDTIVAAGGFESTAVVYDAALSGVTNTGTLNSGFGTSGTTDGPDGSSTGASYESCAVAVAPDGTIITVGDSPTETPDPYPCATGSGTSGFVASYVGDGPAPSLAGAAPTVSAATSSAVTTTAATLSATVNPNGVATTYDFQYGTSTSYGSQTASQSAGSGSTATAASAGLTGLAPGTTYHYRIEATNADGTVDSSDATFTTPASPTTNPAPPSVITGSSTKRVETSTLVYGRVDPNSVATTYYFQYGSTTRYGSSTASRSAGSSSTQSIYSATLSKLSPGHLYHYRVVATNADGKSYGADRTFRTAAALKTTLTTAVTETLRADRITVKLHCSAACTVAGALRLTAGSARTVHLGTREIKIASGSGRLRKAGELTLTLKLSGKDAAAIGQRHGLAAQIAVVIRPTGTVPATSYTRNVKLNG